MRQNGRILLSIRLPFGKKTPDDQCMLPVEYIQMLHPMKNMIQHLLLHQCRCDPLCHLFGECCFDAPELENYKKQDEPLTYKCDGGSAIVSSCPADQFDTEEQRLCEAGVYGQWSPLSWTVYDVSTNLR